MAPLKVRPPVPPPPLTTRCDSITRPPLDTQDVRAAGPAHVCEQEHGQTMNMRPHGLTGSHSSPHSEGARASGRRAQSRGTHEAGKWVRGLEASSAPFEAVEDAEQLGWPGEESNHPPPSKLGGLSPESQACYESCSAQSNLDVCSVQSEIMPCARALHFTQLRPCHITQ